MEIEITVSKWCRICHIETPIRGLLSVPLVRISETSASLVMPAEFSQCNDCGSLLFLRFQIKPKEEEEESPIIAD